MGRGTGGGFVDRGGRGAGSGRGVGPMKRGAGPPGAGGPPKRPRFEPPPPQPANGYAPQPPR